MPCEVFLNYHLQSFQFEMKFLLLYYEVLQNCNMGCWYCCSLQEKRYQLALYNSKYFLNITTFNGNSNCVLSSSKPQAYLVITSQIHFIPIVVFLMHILKVMGQQSYKVQFSGLLKITTTVKELGTKFEVPMQY